MNRGRTVEMPGRGKRGKPTPGFPLFPPPLEIAARFPHSHRPDESRGKVEIQNQDSHFPTAVLSLFQLHQKGGLAADRFAPAFRLILR